MMEPGKKTGQIFTDLSDPRGVAITRDGHLVVTEDGNGKHCITIIDTASGRKIRSFKQIGSRRVHYPTGMAVTQDGRIIVTDTSDHCLYLVTAEGAFIATVGGVGSQPLQFSYPKDVAVDHNGRVFVSDYGNHRVQVLNADLAYSHCFGIEGAKPGELNAPRGIAIDADGMVYVADYNNNRVQKFTPRVSC